MLLYGLIYVCRCNHQVHTLLTLYTPLFHYHSNIALLSPVESTTLNYSLYSKSACSIRLTVISHSQPDLDSIISVCLLYSTLCVLYNCVQYSIEN